MTITWQKSSFSSGESKCVEVARTPSSLLLRESTDPALVIATSAPRLRDLLAGIKAGEFGTEGRS